MSDEVSALNIAIVGGGISGAMAARVLREHHNVTIFERSRAATEAGAAINVGPNAVGLLDKYGYDRQRVGSLPVARTKTFNDKGVLLMEQNRDYKKDFGADWLFQHRADLRNELLRLATASSESLGLKGAPATVIWGKEIVNVDVEQGVLKFADGQSGQYDLVIAADGIKSVVRQAVVGETAFTTARPSGHSAFRFTLNTADILEATGSLPECADPVQPVTLTMVLALRGPELSQSIVIYPCRNFEILNFVCIVPDQVLKRQATESWTAEGDKDELIALFEDFPTWVVDLIKMSDRPQFWQLRDQDPLPTYIRGRTVLIGDAAHAMTPHQGQGGTQAIEDGEGFCLFNQPGVTRASVQTILTDFDSIRRPRASQIQNNTRVAHNRRSAEDMFQFEQFNWRYGGIVAAMENRV